MTGERLDALLDVQMASRHLDHTARWLRAKGRGFYTIGSAGHEANALVAAALRPTDPALLHYRSGGFYLARAQQVPGHDGVRDVLLGLLAAADEPIAGGRHKVFGHPDLAVIPQTSTIASHLPRAMGVAFAIGRARRLGLATRWPADALAVCSFGDASLNHSTAQGALNAAAYTAQQGMPMPVLFVCEDNGWGISVPTPAGWVATSLSARPGLRYEAADGADPVGVFDITEDLADWVRSSGRPAVLHLRTVRYGGHAGTDVETAYRTAAGIRADLERDPLLATARVLVEHGCATADGIVERYLDGRADVRAAADELAGCRPLQSAAEVMTPLSPRRPAAVAERAVVAASPDERAAFFGRLPEDSGPLTLAESINRTLGDLLAADPRVLVFGEDVGAKGGVYGVTRGLQRRAGSRRVFDTLLDEQSILGLALGAGVSGLDADPGDPVPRLPAQRRGPAPRRGGEPVVLLQRAVHQPARRAHRRLRLPEGVRRALPQRQRRRRPPRHPRPRDRLPGPRRRRPGDAADVRRRGRRRRHRERVPRADRPLPHARPARAGRRRDGRPDTRHPRVGRASTSRSARPTWYATATTCSSSRGATACTCRCASPSGWPPTASAAACSTCAGWRRCRSRRSPATPVPSAGSSSSTRRGGRAASARPSSAGSSSRASTCRSCASPVRTRSCRWPTPPTSSSSPRTTSRQQSGVDRT